MDVPDKVNRERPFTRIFNETNIINFKTKISESRWNELLVNNSPDVMCELFL